MTGRTLGAPLRLGTRGSTLARIQAESVAAALGRLGVSVELVVLVTEGDRRPPDTAWGEGAFVSAIQAALLAGSIDLAVHSAKDVPLDRPAELVLAAFPPRADARDALVLRAGASRESDAFRCLSEGAVVGTDSPRRGGFLLAARPDLRVRPLHGNVDTRLRRLDEGEVDALVLAVAGLERLGRADRIAATLPLERVPPAPGQGALAVEVRAIDERTRRLVARLDDPSTRLAVEAERALLDATGGGCRAPVGAHATVTGGQVRLLAGAVGADGSAPRFWQGSAAPGDAVRVARAVGAELAVVRGAA